MKLSNIWKLFAVVDHIVSKYPVGFQVSCMYLSPWFEEKWACVKYFKIFKMNVLAENRNSLLDFKMLYTNCFLQEHFLKNVC